jgi:hypothetical protein
VIDSKIVQGMNKIKFAKAQPAKATTTTTSKRKSPFIPKQTILLFLLQSALQPLIGFRPAQLSLSIFSRKVLQSAVASGTSNPQLGGKPGI